MYRIKCPACEMLKAGVKFRIAPQHTCGKEPKKIKIPRVDPNSLIEIIIQRTGCVETPKALIVRCQKQVIEGITIPAGYEIVVPNATITSVTEAFSYRPKIIVPGWKLNGILRMLYLDTLRNG